MGVLFVLFAFAMAAATFIENDFGSAAAYNSVYNSFWFELILLLLAANLVGQMIIFKLYKKSKLPVFFFHLSFVLMIAGAGITRYFGWEGTIHIREGEEQNSCFSTEKFIGYSIRSLAEVVTCLRKAKGREYISEEEFIQHYEFAFNLMNMMVAFKEKIR